MYHETEGEKIILEATVHVEALDGNEDIQWAWAAI